MTPEDFVAQIRIAILEHNMAYYKKAYEAASVESARNAYWERVLTFYHSLDESRKTVLFEFMRIAVVDAISNFLGILDGSSWFDGCPEEFVLTTTDDVQQVNGDLQSIFLAGENSE